MAHVLPLLRSLAVSHLGTDLFGARELHQSQMPPEVNKFHAGNGEDGKHYWLTPWDTPEFHELSMEFGPFDLSPFGSSRMFHCVSPLSRFNRG